MLKIGLLSFFRWDWLMTRFGITYVPIRQCFHFAKQTSGQWLAADMQHGAIVYFHSGMTLVECHADFHPFLFAYFVCWHNHWDKNVPSYLWANIYGFMNPSCIFWNSQILKPLLAFKIFLPFMETLLYVGEILLLLWSLNVTYIYLCIIICNIFIYFYLYDMYLYITVLDYFFHNPQ